MCVLDLPGGTGRVRGSKGIYSLAGPRAHRGPAHSPSPWVAAPTTADQGTGHTPTSVYGTMSHIFDWFVS